MRKLATAVLFVLLLIPNALPNPIERNELDGNISLIITYPRANYTILSLVNKNDFNVTLVEGIQINFPYDVDPASIQAFDNYNQQVMPEEINPRSITFTYNNTLPALGYGKIFLDSEKLVPSPTPELQPTESPPPIITPPPTPQYTTPPPPTTMPSLLNENQSAKSTEINPESPAPADEKNRTAELAFVAIGLIVFLLLALSVLVLRS
jgi:hypothetical protein